MFFDSIYFSICRFYFKHGDKSAKISGFLFLSLVQSINIFCLLKIVGLFNFISDKKILVVSCYVALVLFNGIRYNKLGKELLEGKIHGSKNGVDKKQNKLTLLYLVFSFLFLIISILL